MTDALTYIPAAVTSYLALYGIGRFLAWAWSRGAVTVPMYCSLPTDSGICWGTWGGIRFIMIRLPVWQWEPHPYREKDCWHRAFLLWGQGRGFMLHWVPCEEAET